MSGPLAGKTVLLTRDGGLADEVRALGAEVRVFAATRTEAVAHRVDPAPFDWIVFTSAKAVRFSKFELGAGPRIACVGPSTTFAVVERGVLVDFRPERHDAESLADGLAAAEDLAGKRVLFPSAEDALPTLPAKLAAAGAEVTRLVVYRTVAAGAIPPEVATGADIVVFLAPSAVEAFFAAGGDVGAATALAIGPTTGAALCRHGVEPRVAPTSNREGIVRALAEWEEHP